MAKDKVLGSTYQNIEKYKFLLTTTMLTNILNIYGFSSKYVSKISVTNADKPQSSVCICTLLLCKIEFLRFFEFLLSFYSWKRNFDPLYEKEPIIQGRTFPVMDQSLFRRDKVSSLLNKLSKKLKKS